MAKLREVLKPYLLRRVKADVFQDFPRKAEILVPVSMTSFQKDHYKALMERNMLLFQEGNKVRTWCLHLLSSLVVGAQ